MCTNISIQVKTKYVLVEILHARSIEYNIIDFCTKSFVKKINTYFFAVKIEIFFLRGITAYNSLVFRSSMT